MANTFMDIINKKKKQWGSPDLIESAKKRGGEKIPFSSPLLNYSTYGGIPRYKVTEFLGEPSGGKSSTAIDICKNALKIFESEYEEEKDRLRQQAAKDREYEARLQDLIDRGPKKVLYVDLEHAFDRVWADKLGVPDHGIVIMQPPDVPGEEILLTIQELVQTDEVGLVVIDSIPSIVTKQELEKVYGERTVAALAGLMTTFMRKIVPLLTRYKCTMLLINQIRDNLDNPYVDNSPGGRAVRYYAVLRIKFKIGSPVDILGNELPSSAENPAGYIVTAKLVKQKAAPWDRRNGSYYLMAQSGIRVEMDFAKLAVSQYGLIRKSGAWFSFCDPDTGEVLKDEEGRDIKVNGFAKVLDYLQTNQDYFTKLQDYIMADIQGKDDEDMYDGIDEEGSEY